MNLTPFPIILRKTSKKSYLFLLCVFLYSCSTKHQDATIGNAQHLTINNNAIPDTLDISPIVDTIELVQLTDAPHKPIGFINQLYSLGSYYIAIDPIYTKRINAYSNNGNYIKTIIENGPSDSNTLNVTDCYVNDRYELIVNDYAQMKVTIFDSSLIKTKSIKGKKLLHYSHIASIPGTDGFAGYASYGENNTYLRGRMATPSNLDILSNSLDVSKEYLTYPKKFQGATTLVLSKVFFPYKDSLRFFRTYDPYIYDVSKSTIQKRYKVIYTKGNFPSDFLESIIEPHLDSFKAIGRGSSSIKSVYLSCNGYTCPSGWLEADNLIYLSSMTFTADNTSKFCSIIFNSNSIPKIYTAKTFIETKRFKMSIPIFNEFDKKNNQLITFCTGNQLKKYLKHGSPLISFGSIVDECFYLIKVRLNNK